MRTRQQHTHVRERLRVHASVEQSSMTNSQKRQRSSNGQSICYLCGYSGRTRSLSIEKNGYEFLRSLPAASGALPVTDQSNNVPACYLCALLLEKQRELNHASTDFFFKGFFRSTGSTTKLIRHPTDHEEQSSPKPPPLRKTIRSQFQLNYQLLSASTKSLTFDSCQLCQSIKLHGTLFVISRDEFPFLSSSQSNVCTLCYYNLIDQLKDKVKRFRRARSQCYLCFRHIDFFDWEVKLLETEYFPFLLRLHHEEYRRTSLYDRQRLALSCDQCFYQLLFQYLDQERKTVPIEQRIYTWQCISSAMIDMNEFFY